MRETYRLQKGLLLSELTEHQKNLAVFIIYNGSTLPEFQNIFEKMSSALQQLQKVIS
jgi:hypothetical protein